MILAISVFYQKKILGPVGYLAVLQREHLLAARIDDTVLAGVRYDGDAVVEWLRTLVLAFDNFVAAEVGKAHLTLVIDHDA